MEFGNQVKAYLDKSELINDADKLDLPNLENLPQGLKDVASKIIKTTATWNPVELYTPSNVDEQKKIFLDAIHAGNVTNPVFEYSYAQRFEVGNSEEILMGLLTEVRRFKPEDRIGHLARVALYFKLKDDLATFNLAQGLKQKDDAIIAAAVRLKYPGLDDSLLQLALIDLDARIAGKETEQKTPTALSAQEIQYLESQKYDDQQLADAFIWTLNEYGMLKTAESPDGFAVVISKEVTGVDVRDKSAQGPTIFIPQGKETDGITLLKLVGHEVEGHARQSVNGRKLFIIGGGPLRLDDEDLYEGLGKRYDDELNMQLSGKDTGVPLPYYSFAVKSADEGRSFHDIFKNQVELRTRVKLHKPFSEIVDISQLDPKDLSAIEDAAWTTTYRVMRSHTDTTNRIAYGMPKDLAYLRGYHLDLELKQKGIGYLNELAVVQTGALQLLAEFNLNESSLPLQYKNKAFEYWEKVMRPQMQTT